jgi:hypothetical protein
MFYIALVLTNLLVFFTTWQFSKISAIDKRWWNFFILPAVFLTGLAVYSTILVSMSLIQFLFIAAAVFLYYYLRLNYYYLIGRISRDDSVFENLAPYGNFLSFFFFAAAAYGLQSFLDAPVWLLIIIMLFLMGTMVYQAFWAAGIETKGRFIYLLIICLILAETGWAISFLPVDFNVAGLVLAVCYYMIVGPVRFYLTGRLNKKIIKLYLSFGFASIVLVLLTARWL